MVSKKFFKILFYDTKVLSINVPKNEIKNNFETYRSKKKIDCSPFVYLFKSFEILTGDFNFSYGEANIFFSWVL